MKNKKYIERIFVTVLSCVAVLGILSLLFNKNFQNTYLEILDSRYDWRFLIGIFLEIVVLLILCLIWKKVIQPLFKMNGEYQLSQRTPKFNGNVTLIIGNGFDLDLGVDSKYSSFYNSSFWPFNNKDGNDSLGSYLQSVINNKIEGWYDLERTIGEYATQGKLTKERIELDKVEYKELTDSFLLYLSDILKKTTICPGYATDLIKHISTDGETPKIYNFNFTDVWDKLTITKSSTNSFTKHTSHVHGSINDNNIILGVGDYEQLPECLDFFYKVMNPKYHSSGISDSIKNSDALIFFGHSLSRVDFPYFDLVHDNF